MDVFRSRTEPGVTEFLDALLTFHYDIGSVLAAARGQWQRAAVDAELVEGWAAVEPALRSALLLAFAWSSRSSRIAESATAPGLCAADLHRQAREFLGTANDFHGHRYPLLPYPGPAGKLASSVGFDQTDTNASLQTTLILATATAPATRGMDDPVPGALHIPSGADPTHSQTPAAVIWPLPMLAGQHRR